VSSATGPTTTFPPRATNDGPDRSDPDRSTPDPSGAGWPGVAPPPPSLPGRSGLACDLADAAQLPLVRALLARTLEGADVRAERAFEVLAQLVSTALAWATGPVRVCVLHVVTGWVVDVGVPAGGPPGGAVPGGLAAGPHGWYRCGPRRTCLWAAVPA
jgi:hypothetical protein